MNRDQMLALIDVAGGRGLEIGPLNRPIVRKNQGRVEYIDRAPAEELRRWYAINPEVDTAAVEEVDHVWGTQTLLDCVGGARAYDYVIASHVIEHVPDLFGWLAEIGTVLVDGGIASFAVPDKRYTFDVLRRTSSESELVDAYVRGLRRPDARQIFDHFYGFREISPEVRSGRVAPESLPPTQAPRALLDLCRRTLTGGDYIDSHCWVFTPRSFVETLDFASRLDLLPFEIASLTPTLPGTDEFFVSLRRLAADAPPERHRSLFQASRARLDLVPEQDRAADTTEIAALRQELDQARQMVNALQQSTSWRITAPLRRAATAWRGLGRRAAGLFG